MANFFVRTTLVVIVPISFGYGLYYFLSHLYLPGIVSIPLALILGFLLAKQGGRNASEYLADRRAGLTTLSPVNFVIRFSLPFFCSIAAAFGADWIDWHYGFFIPSVTGMATGAIVFLIAYGSVAIVYGPLRTAHIGGQQILDYRTALTKSRDLGYDEGFQFGGIRVPPHRSTTHFLIVGATGSGKTLTVHKLLQDMAQYMRSNPSAHAVVYDPKQNILPVLNQIASDLPISDLHPYRENSLAWDLAQDVRSSRDIETVSNILFPEDRRSGDNRFFLDAPRELMQSILRCFHEFEIQNWSFRDLYCVLTSPTYLESLLKRSTREKDVFGEYFKGDERTLSNVRLSLRTRLLRYRPVAAASHHRIREGRKLSLREWNNSTGGFLVLGSDKTPDSGIDALNRAALAMLGRDWLEGPNSGARPQHFLVLDEVQSAGQLSMLPALLTEGREKGVSTILSFQDVASMRHVYGNEQADALLSQFGNKAFLRLEGDSTAQWASKTVGETEQYEYTYSQSHGNNYALHGGGYSTTTTQNEQRVRKAALMPADFLTLPTTNRSNGLAGYYASAEIGIWKHKYEAAEVFTSDPGLDQPFTQDEDVELEPLDSSDEQRLGIQVDVPRDKKVEKPKPKTKLGYVSKFDLGED